MFHSSKTSQNTEQLHKYQNELRYLNCFIEKLSSISFTVS